jgi:hypothetical protein
LCLAGGGGDVSKEIESTKLVFFAFQVSNLVRVSLIGTFSGGVVHKVKTQIIVLFNHAFRYRKLLNIAVN